MSIQKKITQNVLFRVIGYTGSTGILRLGVGLVAQKVIAVFLGASGLAILANLRNLIEILTSFSSVGAQNGIIAETASSQNKQAFRLLINTTITMFLGASILLAILLLWQHEWIAMQLYIDATYGVIIQALAFTIPFMGLTLLMEAVLSGKKAFKTVSNLQLLSAISSAFLMIMLLYYYGIKGALCALLLRTVFTFIIYFIYFKLTDYGEYFFSGFRLDFSKIKFLLPYIFMAFVSVGFVHAINIGLRSFITSKIDLQSAGLWTAMNAISSNYFVFITAIFSLYVLPRFSEKTISFNLFDESKKILKTLVPIITLGLLGVYVFREFITKLLFSTDFTAITSLFKWQLVADWFRVIFLVFGYYLVAKKELMKYFIVELFSFSMLIGLSYCWIDSFGIEGVVMASAVRYVGCLILVVFLLRKKLTRTYGSRMD